MGSGIFVLVKAKHWYFDASYKVVSPPFYTICIYV